jgi:hypothetical protein
VNGPEHYAEAERLLALPDVGAGDDPRDPVIVAAAQVHATLALTAATLYRNVPGDVNDGWKDRLGHVSQPKPADPWATP